MVLLNVIFPIVWDIGIYKDGADRTLWFAQPAVNALVWVNIDHLVAFIDAIYRADGHAGFILDSNAGFGDDVRHDIKIPRELGTAHLNAQNFAMTGEILKFPYSLVKNPGTICRIIE